MSHEEHCIHSTKSVLVLSFFLKHIPQHVVSWVRRKPLLCFISSCDGFVILLVVLPVFFLESWLFIGILAVESYFKIDCSSTIIASGDQSGKLKAESRC